LMSGPLAQSGPEIIAARQDLRQQHGWLMDIYILEKNTVLIPKPGWP
jgi:precorrin-6A synthase